MTRATTSITQQQCAYYLYIASSMVTDRLMGILAYGYLLAVLCDFKIVTARSPYGCIEAPSECMPPARVEALVQWSLISTD